MTGKPLVSIYITNYNYGAYIRQSIESVLSQTSQDFELLIIDDGSTDNSKDIISEYAHNQKISVIYQQNKGLNVTNNIAMRAAQGKYLIRLDADDFLEPTAIEIMAKVMESDPDLGLVFPDYYYVDADGRVTGEEIRHNFDKDVSLYDQPAHGACTMIRLDNLKILGGYNESFTCQDGYDLWIKFIMHYKVTNINKPLFSYRRHGNNLTVNEDRILSTRKKIKATYVEAYKLATPPTVAIVPVRSTFFDNVNWPLFEVNGKSILYRAIQKLFDANQVNWVVVTTAEPDLLQHADWLRKNAFPKLIVIERPEQYAKNSQTLSKTFNFVLNQLKEIEILPEALLSISLEYPFITSDIIDDAINTLTIFKADSLLSVRPDNKMYYQHIGHGLTPILDQEKFSKLEREALYKGLGGLVLSTAHNFMSSEKMVGGKVGHIVVDDKVAFGIFSNWDFNVFKKLGGYEQ